MRPREELHRGGGQAEGAQLHDCLGDLVDGADDPETRRAEPDRHNLEAEYGQHDHETLKARNREEG